MTTYATHKTLYENIRKPLHRRVTLVEQFVVVDFEQLLVPIADRHLGDVGGGADLTLGDLLVGQQ
jgi:hypothetical protein